MLKNKLHPFGKNNFHFYLTYQSAYIHKNISDSENMISESLSKDMISTSLVSRLQTTNNI